MGGQFLLAIIITLLLLANWVTLHSRSDSIYQFKDGELKVGVPSFHAGPALSRRENSITASQFAVLD
jgi:hypothetical protein